MMLAAAVGLVAALGAVSRYVLDQTIQHRLRGVFPWGTLAINVSGSLLLGLFTGLAAHHGLSPSGLAVLGTGFCGGFTTFSTWMWETVALAERTEVRQSWPLAAGNLIGSVVAGLLAAAIGFGLAML